MDGFKMGELQNERCEETACILRRKCSEGGKEGPSLGKINDSWSIMSRRSRKKGLALTGTPFLGASFELKPKERPPPPSLEGAWANKMLLIRPPEA